MAKAIYKGKRHDPFSDAVHLFYEYRGKEYIVTDEHNGYSEPMWVKHKNEQDRIDREIADASKPIEPYTYEGSGQEGFDLLFELLGET